MPTWRRDGLTLVDRAAIRLAARLAGQPALADFHVSLCNLVKDYGRKKALMGTLDYYLSP